MDKEDRIRRFAQMQEQEGQSANRVKDILEQKKIEKKKRDRRRVLRRQLIRSGIKGSLALGIAAVCIVLGIKLVRALPKQETPAGTKPPVQVTDLPGGEAEPSGETILQSDEVQTEPAADAWIDMNPGQDKTFYGNTVLSTAGGVSLDIATLAIPDWINVRFLTVNPFSRPCVAMNSIQYIAIHYVGNAGTTAAQNWSYFEGLKDTQVTKASSHFIVGLEGEVISCIPLNEMSYCTNDRNVDTISIEVCHPDWDGQFNETTYQSVITLTAWLCKTFALPVDHVIRHYDVTGKHCPKYYVENPAAWDQLRADVQAALDQM